jgi:rhamnogalacturonyl hydrolase YesR
MMDVLKDFKQLRVYVEKEQHKGWDPYDGLNSKLFQALPFIRKSRFWRLLWIQAFKKSPLNLRKITFVPKQHNAKGVALFISSYCLTYKNSGDPKDLLEIKKLCDLLIASRNKNYKEACWGYNFDWQARAFFQPVNTPTVVATSYVGQAFIAAYELTQTSEYLDIAKSAADFIVKRLNKTNLDDGTFTYSYSPLDNTQVINAGLLGVRLLSQISKYDSTKDYLAATEPVVKFACNRQNSDGSWPYGTLPFHQWVDNFHTGFNLECINEFQKAFKTTKYDSHVKKGLDYYLNNFFTTKGESKYYNNSLYPIDLHAPAQLIVTLSKLNELNNHKDLAEKVLTWTNSEMKSAKGGFYYYQRTRWYTNKIPYMRWTQAWMFYALSVFSTSFESDN